MKKKRNKLFITRTIKLTSFFMALLMTLLLMNNLFLRRIDQNSLRMEGYYMEDFDSLDVVTMGASDVYTSFASARAYKQYGFTSYPYATQSITASGMLTALKEVVRTQTPQLIVIEVNAFLYKEKKNESDEGHIRKLIDSVPFNQNKIDFVSEYIDPDQQLEYYVPLIKYHDLWKEYPGQMRLVLSKLNQDNRGHSYLKGFRTTTKSYKPPQKILNEKIVNEEGTLALNPTLEAELREMLDYCKEKNLNVLFMRVPHLVYKQTFDRVKRSNRAGEIIRSYGYDYLNLERDWKKLGLDLKTDFYNYDHMNIYGAVKMTNYLGKLIRDKYNIVPEKLSDEQKERWDQSAVYFDKLERYCDHLIKQKKKVEIEEDVNTLNAIEDY